MSLSSLILPVSKNSPVVVSGPKDRSPDTGHGMEFLSIRRFWGSDFSQPSKTR